MREHDEALRSALIEIRDYRPTLPELPDGFNAGCDDCARALARSWPPSGLCNTHYREASNITRKRERIEAAQHHVMQEIARAALSRSSTTATKADQSTTTEL